MDYSYQCSVSAQWYNVFCFYKWPKIKGVELDRKILADMAINDHNLLKAVILFIIRMSHARKQNPSSVKKKFGRYREPSFEKNKVTQLKSAYLGRKGK